MVFIGSRNLLFNSPSPSHGVFLQTLRVAGLVSRGQFKDKAPRIFLHLTGRCWILFPHVREH